MSSGEFPAWPVYAEDERDAVDRVLRSGKSNYWTGEEGMLFEQEFASWCGARYGVCVFNGTLALELALRGCGIEPGDEVIVTPRSFLASAAAVVAIGATPVFADVDLYSGNMTAETISQALSERTKAIVVVHLGGWPADMPAIMDMANSHGMQVIEDCAQAPGAEIHGQRVGTFGHAAAFSFCQDKIMSTGGEGGMVLTNDQEIYDLVWSYRDHGRDRKSSLSNNHPSGFRWLQHQFGTNARMTEMQAAIGRCQLQKIVNWIDQRNKNAATILEQFKSVDGIVAPVVPVHMKHAYYRVTVLADDEHHRNQLLTGLNETAPLATVGPCPEIYREPAFQTAGLVPSSRLPVVEELGRRSISLPTYPNIKRILEAISLANCQDIP